MKIQQLQSTLKPSPAIESQPVHYLHGLVESIDDKQFKLYQDPNDRSSFLILSTESVVGDVHQWTEADLAHKGFIGHSVHRVPVSHGAKVQVVTISHHRIGESLSSEVFHNAAAGACRRTSGCGTKKCCSVGTDGKCYCDDCCIA